MIANRSVIELGCGLGLPGLCASLLGASDVTLTDMVRINLHCSCCQHSHKCAVLPIAECDAVHLPLNRLEQRNGQSGGQTVVVE